MATAEDKAKILGLATVPTPPSRLFDASMGQPLFWSERKSPAFWGSLLEDLGAGSVVEVGSVGGAALGRACLMAGIPYVGLVQNQDHCNWVENLLDKTAVTLIAQSGSSLHAQDLGQLIKEHFADVMEEVEEMDQAVDPTAASDVEV